MGRGPACVLSPAADALWGHLWPLTRPFRRQLSLDSKYQNHTCGLCGDYNGEQGSEFVSEGEGRAGRGGARGPPPGAP